MTANAKTSTGRTLKYTINNATGAMIPINTRKEAGSGIKEGTHLKPNTMPYPIYAVTNIPEDVDASRVRYLIDEFNMYYFLRIDIYEIDYSYIDRAMTPDGPIAMILPSPDDHIKVIEKKTGKTRAKIINWIENQLEVSMETLWKIWENDISGKDRSIEARKPLLNLNHLTLDIVYRLTKIKD